MFPYIGLNRMASYELRTQRPVTTDNRVTRADLHRRPECGLTTDESVSCCGRHAWVVDAAVRAVDDGCVSDVEPDRVGQVLVLRVVVRGVSPLIMRRVVVDVNTTLAALDELLRVVFGWSDTTGHSFRIHGREYGCLSPTIDEHDVTLDTFGLRAGERFLYCHDAAPCGCTTSASKPPAWVCTPWCRAVSAVAGECHQRGVATRRRSWCGRTPRRSPVSPLSTTSSSMASWLR